MSSYGYKGMGYQVSCHGYAKLLRGANHRGKVLRHINNRLPLMGGMRSGRSPGKLKLFPDVSLPCAGIFPDLKLFLLGCRVWPSTRRCVRSGCRVSGRLMSGAVHTRCSEKQGIRSVIWKMDQYRRPGGLNCVGIFMTLVRNILQNLVFSSSAPVSVAPDAAASFVQKPIAVSAMQGSKP